MVFGYEAGVVLFAVGVGAFAEPIFVPGVVAVLALSEEAALPRFVPTLPAPFAVSLCRACLFLPGVIPDVETLLDLFSGE